MRPDRRWVDARNARIRQLHASGTPVAWLMTEFGLSRSTIYEALDGGTPVQRNDEPPAEWERGSCLTAESTRTVLADLELRDVHRGYRGRCVYFVQAGDFGPVKIGVTNYPGVQTRVDALQVGSPDALVIRRVVVGDEALEVALHAAFRDLHMRGEWFRYDGDLRALLETEEAG